VKNCEKKQHVGVEKCDRKLDCMGEDVWMGSPHVLYQLMPDLPPVLPCTHQPYSVKA